MSKMYFKDKNDELCFNKKAILGDMEDECLSELTVYIAERMVGSDYFYCREFEAVGEKSEGGCGAMCKKYKPRNGKSGICVHSGYVYECTDKVEVIKRN